MGLYRRSKDGTRSWWMDYTDAEGIRRRVSSRTDNKQLAQELYDKTRAEVWEQKRLGVKKQRTFDEAVTTFLAEKRKQKSYSDTEQRALWWKEQFSGLTLDKVTQELIVKTIKTKTDVEPATRNRYQATLRSILRLVSRKYEWISEVPTFFLEQEPKGRVRWLEPSEIARLLDALPEHWRDIAEFSFATGLRQSNVLNLRWDQVNLNRRTVVVGGEEMKAGRDHGIPLNEAAVECIRRNIGKHHTYVFTYRGSPLKSRSWSMWQRALKRAGIEDFRPHDMRHTWASMLAQQGVPDNVLQALGAWETPKMVRRYAHHSAASLAPFAAKVDEVLGASQLTSQADQPALRVVQ